MLIRSNHTVRRLRAFRSVRLCGLISTLDAGILVFGIILGSAMLWSIARKESEENRVEQTTRELARIAAAAQNYVRDRFYALCPNGQCHGREWRFSPATFEAFDDDPSPMPQMSSFGQTYDICVTNRLITARNGLNIIAMTHTPQSDGEKLYDSPTAIIYGTPVATGVVADGRLRGVGWSIDAERLTAMQTDCNLSPHDGDIFAIAYVNDMDVNQGRVDLSKNSNPSFAIMGRDLNMGGHSIHNIDALNVTGNLDVGGDLRVKGACEGC